MHNRYFSNSMVNHIFVCGLLMWATERSQGKSMFSLCGCSPTTKHGPGLFPLVPSLTYRLSCAALQKHLNLRWQKCVQLISSTVAPSSGFLLHNTGHHRKSRVHTGTQLLSSLGGAVPVCPVLCHCLLWCCKSHLTVYAHTRFIRCVFIFLLRIICPLSELNCLMVVWQQTLERMGTIRKKHYPL